MAATSPSPVGAALMSPAALSVVTTTFCRRGPGQGAGRMGGDRRCRFSPGRDPRWPADVRPRLAVGVLHQRTGWADRPGAAAHVDSRQAATPIRDRSGGCCLCVFGHPRHRCRHIRADQRWRTGLARGVDARAVGRCASALRSAWWSSASFPGRSTSSVFMARAPRGPAWPSCRSRSARASGPTAAARPSRNSTDAYFPPGRRRRRGRSRAGGRCGRSCLAGVGLSVAAIGVGAALVTAVTAALTAVAPGDSGIVSAFHELGGTLAAAVLSTVAAGGVTGEVGTTGVTLAFTVSAVTALAAAALSVFVVPAGVAPGGATPHAH